MKKLIAALLALCAFGAHAAGYDLIIQQLSADGTEPIPRLMPRPVVGDGIVFYEASSMWPKLGTLDACLSFNTGVLTFNLGCARGALNLTTTGAGAATYNPSTGALNIPTPVAVVTPTINDAPGRTLVTSTSATGFQISATRQTKACYEGSFATTSTIGGPASGTVVLETADTNSTTPGDWAIKARQSYSNNITLAVVLNQVQGNNWTICRDIPPGKFVRLRSSTTGTASVSINTEQQEVTY